MMNHLRRLTVEAVGLLMFSALLGLSILAIYALGATGDKEVLNVSIDALAMIAATLAGGMVGWLAKPPPAPIVRTTDEGET